MRSVSGKVLAKLVDRHGCNRLRVHGSHHIYGKPGSVVRLSIPIHGNQAIKAGLLKHRDRSKGIQVTSVFDHAPRTSSEHKRASQPIFEYWNSSALPSCEVSRDLIEGWFSRYPAAEQDELCSRFRSGDAGLAAAFHELCLHELLIRHGCTITLHPSVAGSTHRPDFKVSEPGGSEFLLEAVTSTEVNTGPKYSPRYNLILDCLRAHKVKDFLLGINELTAGRRNLRSKLLTNHIDSALNSPVADNKGRVEIPPFESEGWRVRVTAFPRGSYPHRTGLLYLNSSRTWAGPSYPLFRALKRKAGRYGDELTVPLVLAVSSFDAMLTDRDYHDQLLGPHGLWGTATKPLYRRVSAILFTKNLWPETLLTGQVESRLYLNPFADQPFRGRLNKLDTFRLADDSWRQRPGRPIYELLELPRLASSLWG